MSSSPAPPSRVVVLGARGVIAAALVDRLAADSIDYKAFGAADLDLAREDAADRLASLLQPDDTLVMVSGLTDQKGESLTILRKNIQMAASVCRALTSASCAQIIYVSSDAVYRYGGEIVSEDTPAAPERLYGTMHLLREQMLAQVCAALPLAILRCSTVVAARDTHNSYGPHRFVRQAQADGRIVLFGDGSETRDYIAVDDVARLIVGTAVERHSGTLNMATGRSASFRELADIVASRITTDVTIVEEPRRVPVTHRGFDIERIEAWFPGFRFTPLEESIAALCASRILPPFGRA